MPNPSLADISTCSARAQAVRQAIDLGAKALLVCDLFEEETFLSAAEERMLTWSQPVRDVLVRGQECARRGFYLLRALWRVERSALRWDPVAWTAEQQQIAFQVVSALHQDVLQAARPTDNAELLALVDECVAGHQQALEALTLTPIRANAAFTVVLPGSQGAVQFVFG